MRQTTRLSDLMECGMSKTDGQSRHRVFAYYDDGRFHACAMGCAYLGFGDRDELVAACRAYVRDRGNQVTVYGSIADEWMDELSRLIGRPRDGLSDRHTWRATSSMYHVIQDQVARLYPHRIGHLVRCPYLHDMICSLNDDIEMTVPEIVHLLRSIGW